MSEEPEQVDGFQAFFPWLAGLFARPAPEAFPIDSPQYQALAVLRERWGRTDSAELLTELTERFGQTAEEAVSAHLDLHITRDWEAVGAEEAHDGTEIDDLIRVLWGPLTELGFEYTHTRDGTAATFCVTRCPIFELAQRTGMHSWLYRLACATDVYSTRGFSPRIAFSRTRTLMQGHECCDHQYRERDGEQVVDRSEQPV